MRKIEKAELEECVSAVARLALWLADELTPESSDVVEADLDKLYELAIAAEKQARATYPNWQ